MIRRWIDWRVMDLIKDNQTFFNRLHVVIDACVISVSYVVSWAIQFTFFVPETTGRLSFETYMQALLFVVPAMLILYYAFSLYTPKRVQGRRLEISNIFKANTLMLLTFMFVLL